MEIWCETGVTTDRHLLKNPRLRKQALGFQILPRAERKRFLQAQCPILCHCTKPYVSPLGSPSELDTQLGLSWEPGNDKQTMYFVFVIKTRHKSVSLPKSHEKKCQNHFCVTTSPFAELQQEKKKQSHNKRKDYEINDGFWSLRGIFNWYFK